MNGTPPRLRSCPPAAALLACLLLAACAGAPKTVVPAQDYYSLATAYFELKKYPEASKYFKLAAGDPKTRNAAEYYLGRVDFETGDAEGAAKRFESLADRDPENTTALRAAAYSWMRAGKWEKAVAAFSRLEPLLPETEDARYNYALALSEAGRFDDAAMRIKPWLDRRPDDRASLVLLAKAERKLNRPEALDHFKAALDLKDEAVLRLEYASCLEDRGLFAKAVESYDLLLSSDLLKAAASAAAPTPQPAAAPGSPGDSGKAGAPAGSSGTGKPDAPAGAAAAQAAPPAPDAGPAGKPDARKDAGDSKPSPETAKKAPENKAPVPTKALVRFRKARALLWAKDEEAGLAELKAALAEGYADRADLEALAADDRIAGKDKAAALVSGALAPAAGKSR